MDETYLPKDWIIKTSTTRPGSIYYFNKKTKESSWELPSFRIDVNANETQHNRTTDNKMRTSPRKRKSGELDAPGSPERDPGTPRSDKRRLKLKRAYPAESQSAPQARDNETPQMKALRQKIAAKQLLQQAKTPVKKLQSTASAVTTPSREVRAGTKRHEAGEGSNITQKIVTTLEKENVKEKARKEEEKQNKKNKGKEQSVEKVPIGTMTPAMKEYYEKLKARKSLGTPRKSEKLIDVPKAEDEVGKSQKKDEVISRKTRGRSIGPVSQLEPIPGPSRSSHRRRTMFVAPNPMTPQPNKNIAQKRIERLRPDLKRPSKQPDQQAQKESSPEVVERFTPKYADLLAAKSLEKSSERSFQRSTSNFASDESRHELDDVSPPKIPKTSRQSVPAVQYSAAARLSKLRNSLHEGKNESMDVLDGSEEVINETQDPPEAMEWETIQDVITQIEAVRHEMSSNYPMELPSNEEEGLDLVDGHVQSKRALYIVIDTNVFLSDMAAVEYALDKVFKTYGRAILVIPWRVIKELDYIKDDRNRTRLEKLKAQAREAIRFLHSHFHEKHPRVLGQTARDVMNNHQLFDADCPDDEILQTCLQIKKSKNCVILLSYDKNLCNKAMIYDIETFGKGDPLDKADFLIESDYSEESMLADSLKRNGQNQGMTARSREISAAENIFEGTKATIKDFLTMIITKELENLYGENWRKYVIIPPPWTTLTVLKCASKHWQEVLNDSFVRRAETIIEELHSLISKYEFNKNLTDVGYILNLTADLVGCAVGNKHLMIIQQGKLAISDLEQRYAQAIAEIREDELLERYNLDHEIQLAEIAFKRFNDIYEFATGVCKTICNQIGKQCNSNFKPFNPPPSKEYLTNIKPEVAANVHRLLQVLSTAIEDSGILHKDHKSIIALYDALMSFTMIMGVEFNDGLSPACVYFCVKHKEEALRNGVTQLRDVSAEFGELAAFRCR